MLCRLAIVTDVVKDSSAFVFGSASLQRVPKGEIWVWMLGLVKGHWCTSGVVVMCTGQSLFYLLWCVKLVDGWVWWSGCGWVSGKWSSVRLLVLWNVFFWFIPAIICSTLTASSSTLQNFVICSAANVPGLPNPKDGGTMTLKMLATIYLSAWRTFPKGLNFWHHHCDNLKSCKVTVTQTVKKLRPMHWRSQIWDLQLSQTWCIKFDFVRASVGQYASCGVPWLGQSVASLIW